LQLSLRTQLVAVVLMIVVAFCSLLLVSMLLGYRQGRGIEDVERRMVPRLELGPQLRSEFEHLRQSMQDAVAAQDPAALDDSIRLRNAFIGTVASAGPALDSAEAAQLRHAVTAYHEAAYNVSRRMLRGEAGESLVDAAAAMQAQQRATEELIKRAAGLDRRDLAGAFGAIRGGATAGTQYTLAIGLVTLVLVVLVMSLIARGAIAQLVEISRGVARFATGDFGEPIAVTRENELGKLAHATNRMASSLERSDWLRTGLAALSDELRSELTLEEAARRALAVVCERLSAVAGVLYVADDEGNLTEAASVAAGAAAPGERRFRAGEGLVGRAALGRELTVVADPPEAYFVVRSGLGAAPPRTLALVPLLRAERTIGVFELALFEPLRDDAREFLEAVREMVGIALEIARSAASLRSLLEKTQRQADLLAAQEEELRASNRELTDQQDELRRANDELEAQRRELSAQNVELEQAREDLVHKATELARVSSYKSQFLANMSHELRTPLNSMLLLSHLLGENEGRNLTPKQVEHAKTINSAGKDLLGLINQVLDLAKIEAGRQDVESNVVRFAELLESAERLFSATAQQKGLVFRTELDPSLPASVTTDRHRLERILVNLLGNALKFTDRGEVSLCITRPKMGVEVASGRLEPQHALAFVVADTGIGIPRAAQERIFAPFEQADARAERRYGGTGLGLAIARESALLLGGDLVVESLEGKGSTFTCYLPEHVTAEGARALPPASEVARRAPVALPDDGVQPPNGRSELLVIEDDPVFAEQLVGLIHRQRFKAVVATSGEDGLALAKEHKPRGIILDVKLPDMDGWKVMERLRRDPATRRIPVHFISGTDAPGRAYSLGAVGFLMKPASPRELLDAIQLVMHVPDGAASAVLIVEDDASQGGSLFELLRSGGLAPLHVTSAREALDALATERFGCVILDLGLPDMDGLGLLETLCSRRNVPMPPVIVHTGRSLTRDEVRRLEAYAQAVVIKGGNSGERLLEEVQLFVQHVRNEPPRPPALLGGVSALPEVSLRGTRVLVADDDMRTVYAVSALLRGKGAEVLVAETGREALELLGANPGVNAVLMDVMMPEMDGYEALRRLRADGRFNELPAIALTAKAMKDERERCIEAGATEYLAKPVDPARLLTTLAALVRKSGHGQSQRP
jgi:CheY-like chemotaxis protein/HAMP domain-containing protein